MSLTICSIILDTLGVPGGPWPGTSASDTLPIKWFTIMSYPSLVLFIYAAHKRKVSTVCVSVPYPGLVPQYSIGAWRVVEPGSLWGSVNVGPEPPTGDICWGWVQLALPEVWWGCQYETTYHDGRAGSLHAPQWRHMWPRCAPCPSLCVRKVGWHHQTPTH